MRKKTTILLMTVACSLTGLSQHLSDIKPLTTTGEYSNPVMSPDGKYVLLTKTNFNGVYLLHTGRQVIETISTSQGSGYGYGWSADGKTVLYKERAEGAYAREATVSSYNAETKQAAKRTDVDHNSIASFTSAKKQSDFIVYTNPVTLKIEARRLDGSASWTVTPDEGQCYNAILSNDRTRVIVHRGAGIYLYHADGSGLIKKIGDGIATAWSPDDKYIIGFLDQSNDGHTITNADLYLYSDAGSTFKKLTTTTDMFEMYPSFTSDGRIIFADDKSGKIYSAILNY